MQIQNRDGSKQVSYQAGLRFLLVVGIVGLLLWLSSIYGRNPTTGLLAAGEIISGQGLLPDTNLAEWDNISVGGYTSRPSVAQGESIDFHVSTDVPTYTLSIWYEGVTRELKTTTGELSGTMYYCTGGYLPPGCGWPVAYTLNVPTDWPSGVYTVEIPTSVKGTQYMIFWVREDNPGSTSQIIFLSSVNTYQAYTNFGGKSFYNTSSSDNVRSNVVSFNRPYDANGLGDWKLESDIVAWAGNEGYPMEYATTYDLQHVLGLLDPYEVVVIGGHSEYWSWDMRQRMKAFLNNGGRLINLSGNTMWWQINYLDEGRTITNYRPPATDPETTPEQASSNPWDFPILDIESAITGVQWRAGGNFGSTSSDPTFTLNDGYGGYWVQHSDHWVYSGTSVSDGDVFGLDASSNVIGAESDGTTFNCATDGRTILGPLANMGTPENFTILGIAPGAKNNGNELGFAVMGIYTLSGGGAVFSGSSTGWVNSLLYNAQVSQVTSNVFDHFLAKNYPAEPVSSQDTEYFFIDRFNCDNLDHDGVLPSYIGPKWYEGVPTHNYMEWSGDVTKVRYTDACGVWGGSGLEMTIDPDLRYQTQIKTNWATTDVLFTRFYLNFSNLVMGGGDDFFLMRYYTAVEGGTYETQASIRVRKTSGGNFTIRFEYNPDTTKAQVATIPSDQWFLLETMWDKPNNQMSMWVDGTRYDLPLTPDLLTGRPGLNRVDLLLNSVKPNTQGQLCLDELAFADRRIGQGLEFTQEVYLPLITR